MEGMKNQLLRLFLSFRKMGGEEGGRGIYKLYHPSIHCFLQYLYHWRDMDSRCRKDAIPEIKLQYIVYFTATSEAEINFPFLLRKRIPDSLREGKKRCVKWYAKSSQTGINNNDKGQATFPWQKEGSWKCGITPSMTAASELMFKGGSKPWHKTEQASADRLAAWKGRWKCNIYLCPAASICKSICTHYNLILLLTCQDTWQERK